EPHVAPPARPDGTQIVRDVDKESCPVVPADALQLPESRHVAVHREYGLCHNQDSCIRLLIAAAFEAAPYRLIRAMWVPVQIARRNLCPFLKSGMGQPVPDDVVGLADQRSDDTKTGSQPVGNTVASLRPTNEAMRRSRRKAASVSPISAAEPAEWTPYTSSALATALSTSG